MSRVFVWGAGRCGRALAQALNASEHSVVGTWNRTKQSAERGGKKPWPTYYGNERPDALDSADVVWFTVPDDVLAELVVQTPNQVALHASGALSASTLKSTGAAAIAACHPLQSFSDDMAQPEHIHGITFGIEGDAEAVQVASQLVMSMSAQYFVVEDEVSKALYHAACCVASNAMVALADRAVNLFEAAGVSREAGLRALAPLISGTAANLATTVSPSNVLTGPIRRGDVGIVSAHIEAIREGAPSELGSYLALAEEVLRICPNAEIEALIRKL